MVNKYGNGGGLEFQAGGLVQTVDASDLVLDEAASVSVECIFSV